MRGKIDMRRTTAIALFMVVLIGLLAWFTPRAGSLLIVREPLADPDAIVSLASHEWERLPEAIELARAYPRSLLILTQPDAVTEFNCHDCSHRVELLVRNGIRADRIKVLPIANPGTHGEAVACRTFVEMEHITRVLIVTSPYHTRRSLAVFRTVFAGTAVQLGIAPASRSPARPNQWWASPYDRWYVRYEWAATAFYAVRYGVWP
jgi:uncharacterized SAM-binding protein YcdF (DUF218 family)